MKTTIAALAAGGFPFVAASALAQASPSSSAVSAEAPPRVRGALPAPSNAFELAAGTGYTQGFGMLSSNVTVPDVVTVGVGFNVGLGYRVNPRFGLFWFGQLQTLNAERAYSAVGFTNTLAVQYHLSPTHQVDPWIELGAGYRVLWENQVFSPSLTTHGFQLGRVRVGVDLRPDEEIAFGPVIGADLDMFLFQDVANRVTTFPDPRFSTFVFAGLQGRFDVGGSRRESAGPSFAAR